MATNEERSAAMLAQAKDQDRALEEIRRMREAAIQLAVAEGEAQTQGCITAGGLLAELISDTARAAGLAAGHVGPASKMHARFIKADTNWSTWLKEAIVRRDLLVRDVDSLGPANNTPAVRQWTESNAADLPGYVAALVVLKADARRWLEGLGVPLPSSLRDTGEAAKRQPAPANTTPRPVQRQRAQELAILQAIRLAGYDPKSLPKNEPGKPGIKAQVSDALKADPIFTGPTVFNKAWERLRHIGDIADAA